MVLMDIAFRCGAVEGDNLLFWGYRCSGSGFLRKVFFGKVLRSFRREILSVGTQISMKAPICGVDFSPIVIGRSILTTSDR